MNKCIVEINSCTVGSTGRIMSMIAETAKKQGFTVYTCSAVQGDEKKIQSMHHIYIGNIIDKKIHLFLSKKTGLNGCFSHFTTFLFLKKLDVIKPDLIHIHNLHNCYVNLPMLFKYIKRKNIPVIWTLHDCWSYTGHCPYYEFEKCYKWKTGCFACPQIAKYPYSNIDHTKIMYEKKKRWFTGANITIVTPSIWLSNEVKNSFLSKYTIKVINNGIDLDLFKYYPSNFRKDYGLEKKFLILGVASSWAQRKGLDVFIRLSEELPEEYQIVIVGIDEKTKEKLPKSIVSITRTNNQKELAEIYSSADIYINPTREENFPTTNIEALACGTGVITYRTGGSPEIVDDKTGIVVDKDDFDALKKAIYEVREKHLFDSKECRKRALHYSSTQKYNEYIEMFNSILGEN